MISAEHFNQRGAAMMPGHLGIVITGVVDGEVRAEMPVRTEVMAPNGFLHAASVIALADTACGFAVIAHLPAGAESFTTIELKCNFLGTAREGAVDAVARGVHLGRNTQVWDATVTEAATGKTLALFRCTQMILWPRAAASAKA